MSAHGKQSFADKQNAHAREYFAAQAEACRRQRAPDPQRILALESFARGYLSFELPYSAPASSTEHPYPCSYADLRTRLPGLRSLAKKGRLMSGWEIYQRGTMWEPYYQREGDNAVVRDNLKTIGDARRGKRVLELCVGDGKRTSQILNMLLQADSDYLPASYTINDIVEDNLKPTASKNELNAVHEISKSGFPRKKIDILPGDIFSDAFWRHDFSQYDCVDMYGASVGLFSLTDLMKLFRNFKTRFKPGTTFFISADGTDHAPTLESAYSQSEDFRLWLSNGYVFAFSHALPQKQLNASFVSCKINVTRRNDCMAIEPVISIEQPQTFVLRKGPNGKDKNRDITYTTAGMKFESNHKFSLDVLFEAFSNAGLSVHTWLPLRQNGLKHIRHGIWSLTN